MPPPATGTERLAIEQSRRRRTERRVAAANLNNQALQTENRGLKWELEALRVRVDSDEFSFTKLDVARRRLALISDIAGAQLDDVFTDIDRKRDAGSWT